jgi:polysaccharide deacetylase 2 family uncharacterized protein YibQ
MCYSCAEYESRLRQLAPGRELLPNTNRKGNRRQRPVRIARNRRRRRAGLLRLLLAVAGFMIGGAVTASLGFIGQAEKSTVAPRKTPAPIHLKVAAADDANVHRHQQTKPPVRVSRRKIYGDIETEPMTRQPEISAHRQNFDKLEFIGPDEEPERQARPGEGTPVAPAVLAKPDGQAPWLKYAAASPVNPKLPMVALVLDDVGLNRFRGDLVLALQHPITVAVLPYGRGLSDLTTRARAAGHEIIVHLPMEPRDRSVDPGPHALMVGLEADELQRRLDWNLQQFGSYVGVSNHMGSRFTASKEPMERFMRVIKERGLLYLDSVTSERSVGLRTALRMGVPAVSRDLFIDTKRDRAFIRRQLAAAEQIARKTGFVVAIGHPYPETLEELATWLPALRAKGILQVPISAIVLRKRRG